MSSLGVKLPLTLDDTDGFTMLSDLKTLLRQNLKMLILTAPGERIMEPDFGAGLRNYLFTNYGEDVPVVIDRKIREQVRVYMPIINLIDIQFDTSTAAQDTNSLGIRIIYSVPDVGVEDLLDLTI
jgi:phage baseplate assembly protein W